jgi:hypothetical protein
VTVCTTPQRDTIYSGIGLRLSLRPSSLAGAWTLRISVICLTGLHGEQSGDCTRQCSADIRSRVDKVPYSSPEKIPDMMALPKFR